MKGPKIVIEIPKEVNHKIMVYQGLMEDLRQSIPTKRELITGLLLNGPQWLDQRIEIANQAVEAVAKV